MKKASIRAIDQGTLYDVTGKLRQLTREIERGERGKVRNVVIILEQIKPDSTRIAVCHYGESSRATAHWMTATALNRMEPA